MGAPNINIAFYEQAVAAIARGEKGIVAMILVDESVSACTNYMVYDVTDIPAGLSAANQTYIKAVLKGYQTAPRKVIVEAVPDAESYAAAMSALELMKWDYLVAPTATADSKASDIVTWVKAQRDNNHKIFKAVLANNVANHEGIINVVDGYTDEDGTALTADQACARIAGIIAGTPWTMSCTYAPIPEATGCTNRSQSDLDTAVDEGKLCLMWDGEKVKIVRGVNSLTTTSETKGDSFKKIRLVEIMDMISSDIRVTAQDNYIGKYTNSYDNKCLLTTAINGYFDTLVQDGILASGRCDIDVAAQTAWIKSHGGKLVVDGETVDIADATEDQIRRANTGSQVFLQATISMLDAIEDIKLDIYIG